MVLSKDSSLFLKMDRAQLIKSIRDIASGFNQKNWLSENYSPQKYIEFINNYPPAKPYDWVSDEVKAVCEKIKCSFGQDYLQNFHKNILLRLIMVNLEKIFNKDLPEEVQLLYLVNFERISREIQAGSYAGPFLYENDKFSKDLAVCSMRMIPVGARKIHLSRLPKRFLFKNGIKQFLKGLTYVFFALRGFSPLYEMHTDSKDPDLIKCLNEAGWINSYHLISDLLKSNKKIRGVFAVSWFYDPQLENISPKFYLLNKMAAQHGGRIFYFGSDAQIIRDSTLKSKTRKKLYEEGKYLPTSYLLIWSRKMLIRWSKKKI